MLGLDDCRSALCSEVFANMDRLPKLCLPLNFDDAKFGLFFFRVVPAMQRHMTLRRLVLVENVKNILSIRIRPLWEYLLEAAPVDE